MRAFLGSSRSPEPKGKPGDGDIRPIEIETMEDLLRLIDKFKYPVIVDRLSKEDFQDWPYWGDYLKHFNAKVGEISLTIYDDYIE